MRVMAQLEGISMEPAAAVACAGLVKLVQDQVIKPHETVVVNASGHTFPIEKQILESEIVKRHTRVQNIDGEAVAIMEPDVTPIRQEGLINALKRLDEKVQSVAIIEDEPDARLLLRRILQYERKYKIYEAADGASGMALIQSKKPDLVLLDLMMPEVDGFTVLDTMKANEQLRDIPVIVITAKDLTSQDHQRLSGRIESLLQKGEFMEDQLVESISDVLK